MGKIGIDKTYSGLVEILKAKYQDIQVEEDPERSIIWVEFNGVIEITIEDFKQLSREYILYNTISGTKRLFAEIQQFILTHMKNSRVIEFRIGEKLVIEDIEKLETICVRVSKREKEYLESKAKEMGISISELIRLILFGDMEIK